MILPDPSRTSWVSLVLKRRSHPTQPVICFDTVVPMIRLDLFVTVAVLLSRYIGFVVSKEIISELRNTGTPFPMISLKSG